MRCVQIGGQEGRIEAADSEAAATSTTQKLGKEVDVQPRPTSLAKQPGKHLTYVIEAATRPKLSLKGSTPCTAVPSLLEDNKFEVTKRGGSPPA